MSDPQIQKSCVVCDGSGVDPEPISYQACCRSPLPSGECCGQPVIEHDPQPCRMRCQSEASRIAQDLAYMAARNSGEIERRQIAATSAMETQLSMWRCNGGM